MRLPCWIQRADFSATDHEPVDADTAVHVVQSHDWRAEWQLEQDRRSSGLECCPAGIGFVGGRRILHICPAADGTALVHYHPHGEPVVTNHRVTSTDIAECIRRFYADDHLWLTNMLETGGLGNSTMTQADALYRELNPDVERLANPLFDASRTFVTKRGAFLPHGAVLTKDGEVRLMMAVPPGFEARDVSSLEILPSLHEVLRQAAGEEGISALAVCEDVRITPDGSSETPAIKVLIEHCRGLCVALYMPYRRRLFGYAFAGLAPGPRTQR
jgi:hypothetical protein